MPTTPLFVAAAIFMFVAAGGITLYLGIYGGHTAIEDRLNDLAIKVRMSDNAFEDADAMPDTIGKMLLQWAVKRLPAPKLDTPNGEKLLNNLAHAGFSGPNAVRVFQVVRLGVIASGVLIGFVLALMTHSSVGLLYAVAGGGIGSFLPSYYVGSRARKRKLIIARELSDILDLLVVCIESGLGIFESIRVVGREAERQGRLLGYELSMLSAEIAAGASMAQGLRSLAERTGVDDVKSLAAILIQSEKLGSQMGPALRANSDSMRTKRRLRAEEAAQKSTVKMLFPLVLFVLPAMLIVIVGPALIQIIKTLHH